jgi:hypothetical protein
MTLRPAQVMNGYRVELIGFADGRRDRAQHEPGRAVRFG